MSKTINIDELEDGMILAQPVTNNFGQKLVPAGAIIKESHKKILKTWNIRSIAIKSDEYEESIEISEAQKALAIEYVTKRLDWIPKTIIEKDLFLMGVKQAAVKLFKRE